VHPGGDGKRRQRGLPVQDAPQHRQGRVQRAGGAGPQGPFAPLPHWQRPRHPQVAPAGAAAGLLDLLAAPPAPVKTSFLVCSGTKSNTWRCAPVRCLHWRCSCMGKSLEALSRRMLHFDPWCTDKDDWLSPLSANPLGVSKVNYSVVHAVLLSSSSISLMYVAPSSTQTTDKLAVRQPAGAQRQTVFRASIVHTLFLASAPMYSSGTPFSGAKTTDDSLAPLSINCWPSVSGAESYVNIEYEATEAFDLQTVVIAIPLPALAHAPKVNSVRISSAASAPRHLLRGGIGSVSATPSTPSFSLGQQICPGCACSMTVD